MRSSQFLPLLFVVVAIPLGYFGGKCGVDATCSLSSVLNDHVFTVLKPLWVFSLHSIPAVLFLPFVKKSIFSTWLRFASVWLIVSIFLIIQAPEAMNSWFYVFSYVKEDVAQVMGTLFSAISLLVLGILSYTRRNQTDR